jgi:hypothetical protein
MLMATRWSHHAGKRQSAGARLLVVAKASDQARCVHPSRADVGGRRQLRLELRRAGSYDFPDALANADPFVPNADSEQNQIA